MNAAKKFKIKKYCFAPISMVLSLYKSADIPTTDSNVRAAEICVIDAIMKKMKVHSSELSLPQTVMIYDAFQYFYACLHQEVSFDRDSVEFQNVLDNLMAIEDTFDEITPLFVHAGIISPEDDSDESIPQNNSNELEAVISSLTVSIDDLQESLRDFKNEGLQYVRISFSESEELDGEIFPSTLELEAFSETDPFGSSCDSIESVEA